MITTYPEREGIPAFFGIEPQRAEEMVNHFEAVEIRRANELREAIKSGYDNQTREGIEIFYSPIITECLTVAATPNEAAYASFCAAQMIRSLEEDANAVNRQVGFAHLLKSFGK